MGVDTRIELPSEVCVRHVADAIGILLGCPKFQTMLSGSGQNKFMVVRVDGIKIEHIGSLPECVNINLTCPKAPKEAKFGNDVRSFLYHFEFGKGKRGLMPRAHPANIALGVELVKLFGGSVDFIDCDNIESDFQAPMAKWLDTDQDSNFDAMQEALWNLEPLTAAQIREYDSKASYHLDGSRS